MRAGFTLGREFGKLWVAAGLANLGDGIRLATIPLLAATLTRDPVQISGLYFTQQLPWLLVSLVSGALADRLDRRRLMGMVHLGRTALMGIVAAAVATDTVVLPLLYGVAFALGTAETLADSAASALLPAVTRRQDLERANGRLEATVTITNQFAGPALGVAVFSAVAAGPFLLDSLLLAGAGALVLALRPPARGEVRPSGASLRHDIAEGLRWLWGSPVLRALTGLSAVMNLAINAMVGILVLYALEVLRLTEAGYGVLLVSWAVGGVLGGLGAAEISGRLGRGATLLVASSTLAATLMVTGLTSSAAVAAVMQGLMGFAGGLWAVVTVSLRQSLVPDRMLGRIAGAHYLVSYGCSSLGTLVGGLVATAVGLRAPLLLGSALVTLSLIAVGRVAVLLRHHTPFDPAEPEASAA